MRKIPLTATLTTSMSQTSQNIALNNFEPNNDFEDVYISLSEIFEKELNKNDSILIKVDKSAIAKMAMFLSGSIDRSASIGIAGETASGKSTVAQDIIDTISTFAEDYKVKNAITRINTDDYYYDRSDMVQKAGSFAEFAKDYDLDVPQALELELMKKHIFELLSGKSVMLPKYDMSGTAIRYDNYSLANPSKIVISEGLFSLTEKIRDAFDFKIYVDVRNHIQAERFYIRAAERNLGDSAQRIYENASQKAEIYIRPCKENADIILSGEADRDNYKAFLNNLIDYVISLHFSEAKV
ncbi:MAG: hypothetical protein PHV37_07190 [Candidatus Gastranaerophilales bacterium]|nr:hypothetical protein [Candidatus Gastranaerophilales bacterium]